MTTDHLFVYGTLCRESDQIHPMLETYCQWMGEAKVQGKLYVIEDFPGLVLNDEQDDWVYGELYRVKVPEKLFATLDEYEVSDDQGQAKFDFKRKRAKIVMHDETSLEAWLYSYDGDVHECQKVASGKWVHGLESDLR